MKKVVMSIALAGLLTSLSAADFAAQDAEFLFGANNVDVIAMSGAEMVNTEGQLLGILNPVLGLVGGLPIVGPLVGPLLTSLLGTVDALLMGLPVVGPLLGTVDSLVGGLTGSLLGGVTGALPTGLLGGLL